MKIIKLFGLISLLFLTIACLLFIYLTVMGDDHSFASKKINIVSNKNGVGLSQDIEILQHELSEMGHEVRFVEDSNLAMIQKADINLLVQPLNLSSLPYADQNYLIPNAEWCYLTAEEIGQFDKILCKTKEAERIFKPLNANTVFLGFTCRDRYDQSVEKDFTLSLHLAGKSTQKGTDTLIKTWIKNPQWPELILIQFNPFGYPPARNIKYLFGYQPIQNLIAVQNQCGLHVCPSETEGFGYYIMEGLSTGAVVIATDAPPMNEFIKDRQCLIGVEKSEPMQWATRYYVSPKKLDKTITDLLTAPVGELKKIGEKNRQFYLENDKAFRKRLNDLFR